MFSRIDPMVRLLVLATLLASLFPATGPYRDGAQLVSNAAVFLLFFLNGMRLSRRDVARGMANWRYLSVLALWSFGALALVGLGFARGMEGLVPPLVALGFLYLGVLPSTVQSATAYTSMAGGNVAIAVVAAALLNILGVFVSVPIFAALGGGAEAELGTSGLVKIFLVLILPFALGQMLQSRGGQFVHDHPVLIRGMDRAAISIAVYVAFSGAVEQGIWGLLDAASWGWLLGGLIAMLTAAYGGAWLLGGAMRLDRADRIAFLFGGGHKSVAMGAPLALVLFPAATAGLILVPLLIYHLLQLVVSAPLANRLSAAPQ
ncbi:bile acid:sodium symporter family protein [Allopontixanthobacter sp.]|uniref:bile acid:sodium symporter family protein n=1 Tax=Allopontixanthobacter sp. TaxID=2906452 RepID=UPI002AB943FC|nr:bile acid:sodium symporter family protein [Allopontixanthobacter sp.]MDZ4307744.1 bile acid:sodium symporter family protein [Allopontixanthobacter sp.]